MSEHGGSKGWEKNFQKQKWYCKYYIRRYIQKVVKTLLIFMSKRHILNDITLLSREYNSGYPHFWTTKLNVAVDLCHTMCLVQQHCREIFLTCFIVCQFFFKKSSTTSQEKKVVQLRKYWQLLRNFFMILNCVLKFLKV